MTALRICSDLHLDGGFQLPPSRDADVVILAGDIARDGVAAIQWMCEAPAFDGATAVIYVPGNHEYYGQVLSRRLAEMRKAAAGTRVHVLDCDELILDRVRYLGCTLWTDFALRTGAGADLRCDPEAAMDASQRHVPDYRFIQVQDGSGSRLMRPQDSLALHRAQRTWLKSALERPFDGPTVVVTHMAPHRGSLAPRYMNDATSAAFVSELPDSMFSVPALWVHGHTHTSFDYVAGTCRVLCNPKGYATAHGPENSQFNPHLLVQVAA